MVERELRGSEGSKAVGFSHADFGFVVEPFDDAAGEQLVRPEVIQATAPRPVYLCHHMEAIEDIQRLDTVTFISSRYVCHI